MASEDRDRIRELALDAKAKAEAMPGTLLREGGPWLGAVRNWMKREKRNGELVTWSSDEPLSPPITVREVEEIGATAAAIAFAYAGELAWAVLALLDAEAPAPDADRALVDALAGERCELESPEGTTCPFSGVGVDLWCWPCRARRVREGRGDWRLPWKTSAPCPTASIVK